MRATSSAIPREQPQRATAEGIQGQEYEGWESRGEDGSLISLAEALAPRRVGQSQIAPSSNCLTPCAELSPGFDQAHAENLLGHKLVRSVAGYE